MLKKIIPFCRRNILWLFLLATGGISSWLMIVKMQHEGWRYTVLMDGRGYYAQLPAYFIYHDPQYKFYSKESATQPDTASFMNELGDGKMVNKYFAGEAFVLVPFFGAAHLVAHAAGYPANGFSQPYFYAVAIAAIFYYLLGLFFLWKLLEKFHFRKRVILLACICFAFGTNLFHYAVYEPSMSHIYSFAAISAFLYGLRCFFLSPSFKKLFLCALAFGIIALIRPINIIVFLAFPIMAGNMENLKSGFQWIMKRRLALIPAIVIIGLVGFVQLFIYHWATGDYFIYAYHGEGFDFVHPHFHATLFSFEKGLFVYTPMICFAVFGLIIMFRRSEFIFFFLSFLFVIIAWIVSSWHEYKYGYSFGLRAYVDYYALFAFAMAFFIDFMFRKKILSVIAIISCGLIITLYGIQQYQFVHRIIHPGGMNEKAYWKVFLKTGKAYEGFIRENDDDLIEESNSDFNDMEGGSLWPARVTIVSGIAHSGNKSSRIDSVNLYSSAYIKYMSGKSIFNDSVEVEINAFVYPADTNSSAELQIFEVENDKVFYSQIFPVQEKIQPGEWAEIRQKAKIPGAETGNEVLKIFFKRNSGTVYIDDFGVTIKEN